MTMLRFNEMLRFYAFLIMWFGFTAGLGPVGVGISAAVTVIATVLYEIGAKLNRETPDV